MSFPPVPVLPKPSKAAAEAAVRAVYGDQALGKKPEEKKSGWGWPSFFSQKEEVMETPAASFARAETPASTTNDASSDAANVYEDSEEEEVVSTYEAGRVMNVPRERNADGELTSTTKEKTGMGVSAAAVGLASAAAAITGESAVVTVSAAAVLGAAVATAHTNTHTHTHTHTHTAQSVQTSHLFFFKYIPRAVI